MDCVRPACVRVCIQNISNPTKATYTYIHTCTIISVHTYVCTHPCTHIGMPTCHKLTACLSVVSSYNTQPMAQMSLHRTAQETTKTSQDIIAT